MQEKRSEWSYIGVGGVYMNRRDMEQFRNIDELWNEKLKEELGLSYTDDKAEEIKDK